MLVFMYAVLAMLILIYGILHGTYDFSRLDSVASNLVTLSCVIFFSSYFYNIFRNETESNSLLIFSRYIYYSFSIQAMVITASLLSPAILGLVQRFQISSDVDRALKYEGVRGLALAGGQFFPLSSAFAIAQIFCAYYLIKKPKMSMLNVLFMAVIGLAGLTAGRTSIIGTFVAITLFIYAGLLNGHLKKLVKYLVVSFVFFLCGIVVIAHSKYSDLIFNTFLPFAFEYIYTYLDTGSANIESTSVLSEMYWRIPVAEFLLGYGRYINSDGSTFMYTDGGYMRNLLFFGLFGTFYLVVSQLIILSMLWRNQDEHLAKVVLICLVCMLYLLHIKGDVLLHLVTIQTIISLLLIAVLCRNCSVLTERRGILCSQVLLI